LFQLLNRIKTIKSDFISSSPLLSAKHPVKPLPFLTHLSNIPKLIPKEKSFYPEKQKFPLFKLPCASFCSDFLLIKKTKQDDADGSI